MSEKNTIENTKENTKENTEEKFLKYGEHIEDLDEEIDNDLDESINYDESFEDKKEKRKPRKQQIIDDIKELSKKMGIECQSDNRMQKATIVTLEEKLGKLVNRSLTCNFDPQVIREIKYSRPNKNIIKTI